MKINWPQNKQMAVCLTWDVDGESAPYVRTPDEAERQLSELHQRRYGPTIGMKRILNLLDKHDLKGTFYIPGYIAEVYKEMTQSLVYQGHSVGLHGYLHESLDTLDKESEENILKKSKEVISNLIDYEPKIYRSPSWELNRWTPDLLIRNGILSDSSLMDDEVPYELKAENGSIIEIPIQWILDDAEYWMHTRANRQKSITDPDTVFKIWSREFNGYYNTGGCFVLTLHPFISGRSVYMDTIEKFIIYMKQFPNIWWTNIDELTDYCKQLQKNGSLEVKESPPAKPFEIIFK
jgi:peptidoglycan/xylan/chitin deacetylase (PgdA/CDA1 family)